VAAPAHDPQPAALAVALALLASVALGLTIAGLAFIVAHQPHQRLLRLVCDLAVEGRDDSDRAVSRVDRSYPRNLPRPK
jgi:hypothetical protein